MKINPILDSKINPVRIFSPNCASEIKELSVRYMHTLNNEQGTPVVGVVKFVIDINESIDVSASMTDEGFPCICMMSTDLDKDKDDVVFADLRFDDLPGMSFHSCSSEFLDGTRCEVTATFIVTPSYDELKRVLKRGESERTTPIEIITQGSIEIRHAYTISEDGKNTIIPAFYIDPSYRAWIEPIKAEGYDCPCFRALICEEDDESPTIFGFPELKGFDVYCHGVQGKSIAISFISKDFNPATEYMAAQASNADAEQYEPTITRDLKL